MHIGYVQIPVGIAGPPLRTLFFRWRHECFVRRWDNQSSCSFRFVNATTAAELKFFIEDPMNFETLSDVFNKSSRFVRLQNIQCAIAGKSIHEIEGRGKSVVCEAIIKEEVVKNVLKIEVAALVELNMLKNRTCSAMDGVLGGFSAHASNIVSIVSIATGHDPSQNFESSRSNIRMEDVNDSKDLHISVTMPSIKVGTVGGGTQLSSQSACLNLLGVIGANREAPGSNARLLATIVAGSVLAGELSLMSATSAGQLVNSNMKYNRSSKDVT
ncbi:3-hydroxy-3-methylglutaryl-coenzyme A reductase 2 [Capsicum annuum]|uniref:hydroxymethylglutaryl-CoA reductase (NADPH) n=1 Tax=Capsicum annuum TaxID=4072 RepID=A0A2G3AIE1_CAPAN|nr:3-hydroxy-3-methylglutaryl-coenzyme A reductase 2 [Capsicum annuum]